MGCDIHIFAEFLTHNYNYEALSDGEFLIPSDYNLFAALAGIRCRAEFAPLIPPRGIPSKLSQYVADRYFVPVLSDQKAVEWHIGEHFTIEEAHKLTEKGDSQWLNSAIAPLTPSTDGYISHPDWHTPSWMTCDEVLNSLEHAKYPLIKTPEEFQLLLEYVINVGKRKNTGTRVVFWFDN